MIRPVILASRTSGVDGSSEGGRINTEILPLTLAIYGTALADELRFRGYKGRLRVEPRLFDDGIWGLVCTYSEDKPASPPERWHGRRVRYEKEPPPPPPPEKK